MPVGTLDLTRALDFSRIPENERTERGDRNARKGRRRVASQKAREDSAPVLQPLAAVRNEAACIGHMQLKPPETFSNISHRIFLYFLLLDKIRAPLQCRNPSFDVFKLEGFVALLEHTNSGSDLAGRRRTRIKHDFQQRCDGCRGSLL